MEIVFEVVNDTAKIVPVKTGISDDTNIEITEGLKQGDEVVTGSYRAITKELKNGSVIMREEPVTNK